MKSLVTGGAGFIGSHIVDKLLKMGHEVVCYDDESAESNERFYRNPKAYNIVGDIRDYKLLKNSMTNIDYVFHLAAHSRIQPALENPIDAVSVNCVGTVTVLQCARESGVKKVIYSSTSSGYGLGNVPNVETQQDNCLNPYSVSKVSGEKLCKMYTDLFGLPTVIFRYFNVYGERQPLKGQYAPVIGIFLRQHANNEPLTIVGDGNQSRDFTHVSDVVNANILAMQKDIESRYYGTVYNIGSGTNYSVNEIANLISSNQVNIPNRPGEAKVTLANNKKVKHIFGWKPKVNVVDWIEGQLRN